MEDEKLDLILERLEELEKKVEDNNNILHSERNSKR
jgi:tetrahydromethanopterin S-methyltransferase subunit G